MLKELEALQSELTEKHENTDITPKDVGETETKREVETIELNLATDIHGESVEPNSEDHFFQDIEIADEGNLLEYQENENLSNEQIEIIDNEMNGTHLLVMKMQLKLKRKINLKTTNLKTMKSKKVMNSKQACVKKVLLKKYY